MSQGILEYIKSDLYRYAGDIKLKSFIICYLKKSVFRWQVAFRLCNSYGLVRYLGYILWIFNCSRKRIQIPRCTKIGYGLRLEHEGFVIINGGTIIGNNCNISHFVTIGSNEGTPAIIGNNVYIGPNSCIVENVKVGNNVTIGAASVVCHDIPDNATVVGNYAKVINFDLKGKYINNRWTNC